MTAAMASGAFGRTSVSVTVSPESVSGFGNSGASANITTGLTVATPQGGVSPFTYAWTQVSTSPYTWVIGAPSAATTSFTANSLGPGTTTEADFLVTVTDATGQKATATVNAFANNGQPYDDRTTTSSRRGITA